MSLWPSWGRRMSNVTFSSRSHFRILNNFSRFHMGPHFLNIFFKYLLNKIKYYPQATITSPLLLTFLPLPCPSSSLSSLFFFSSPLLFFFPLSPRIGPPLPHFFICLLIRAKFHKNTNPFWNILNKSCRLSASLNEI